MKQWKMLKMNEVWLIVTDFLGRLIGKNKSRKSYVKTSEFEQAKKKKKTIIIVYNSTRKEANWLPSYMSGYKDDAKPFWKYDASGKKVGDYAYIKEVLGF